MAAAELGAETATAAGAAAKAGAASVLRSLLRAPVVPEDAGTALAGQLGRLVSAAVEVLDVDSVGLMLIDDENQLRTVGFTDAPASTLEDAQARIGVGPGLDTWRHGQTVAVTDLATAPAYGALWQEVAGTGLHSVLSCPVTVHDALVGNFNVARYAAHDWTETEIRAAQAYAGVVAVTLDLGATAFGTASTLVRLWMRSDALGGSGLEGDMDLMLATDRLDRPSHRAQRVTR